MSESILEEAQRIIHGARNVAYGHPRDNFAAISGLWNGYLDAMATGGRVHFSPQDVANMMILMKVGRVCNDNYHRDSYTDIAGYAGTAERMQEPVETHEVEVPLLSGDVATITADGPKPPLIFHDWPALLGLRGYIDTGTRVRNEHGVIWTLHRNEHLTGKGGEWLWSLRPDIKYADVRDQLREGPFTEILPE